MSKQFTYGSVFSGIEAATVAWEGTSLKPLFFSEIDEFPSAVLEARWPHVTNLGDMTRIGDMIVNGDVELPDVIVGGSPCQAFSFAGLRGSLGDERGQLTLEYVKLLDIIDEEKEKQWNLKQKSELSSCGKTSSESLVPETTHLDRLLAHSWEKTNHLSRQGKDGRTQVLLLDPKEQSRGESWMPNISEWHNGAAVSFLSEHLQDKASIHPKYYLSSTAKEGILRRVTKNGKKIPQLLRKALEEEEVMEKR